MKFPKLSRRFLLVVLTLGLIWSSCASRQAKEPETKSRVEPQASQSVAPPGETQAPAREFEPPTVMVSEGQPPAGVERAETTKMDPIELYKKITPFVLPDAEGALVSVGDFVGKKTLLIAFWDPDNEESVRQLEYIQGQLKANPIDNVHVISIIPRAASDAAEAAAKTAKQKGFDFDILFDKTKAVSDAFYIKNVPVFYIINAKSELVSFGVINLTATFGSELSFYDILAKSAAGEVVDKRVWFGPVGPSFCDSKGEKIKGFTLKDRYGKKTYSLADYQGKMSVLLVFWSHNCGHCKRELPILSQYYYSKKTETNFEFLSVVYVPNEEYRKPLDQYLDANPLPFQVLNDTTGDVFGQYNITGVPTWAIIDKDGVMQFCTAGYRPDTVEVLDEYLSKLE